VLLAVVALSLGQLSGRVESQLEPVSLYLNVQKGGDLVAGLLAGSFRLSEDGKSQPFRLEKLRGSCESFLDTSRRMTFMQAQAFLQILANKTGGFASFPRMPSAFPDVMEGIMQSIATQCRIDYETSVRGSGKFRKLKLEAFRVIDDKREDFKVLVREGWR